MPVKPLGCVSTKSCTAVCEVCGEKELIIQWEKMAELDLMEGERE